VQFPKNLGEIYKVRIGFAIDTKHEENWMLDTVRTALIFLEECVKVAFYLGNLCADAGHLHFKMYTSNVPT